VVECWDRQLKKRVAVKIVRAIEKYRDAAKLEIEVLETLQKYDPHYEQYTLPSPFLPLIYDNGNFFEDFFLKGNVLFSMSYSRTELT
jgi:hypothetical protein